MATLPLPEIMIEPLVQAVLLEDLDGVGDVTTNAIVPADVVAMD
jgi:nicotinate-nucleotide pyrophosphorylase (carboxylating)